MKLRLPALSFLVALTIGAPASDAAVTVVGGGFARDCYVAVEFSREPPSRALSICNLALEEEALSRRDRAATLVNRGILHLRESRNQRAMIDFERSLRLTPTLLEGKINLGAALFNLGRHREALAALSEGLGAEDPNARATGFYNRALTREALGDVPGAYEDLQKALELRPDFTQAAEQLSRYSVVRRGG